MRVHGRADPGDLPCWICATWRGYRARSMREAREIPVNAKRYVRSQRLFNVQTTSKAHALPKSQTTHQKHVAAPSRSDRAAHHGMKFARSGARTQCHRTRRNRNSYAFGNAVPMTAQPNALCASCPRAGVIYAVPDDQQFAAPTTPMQRSACSTQ